MAQLHMSEAEVAGDFLSALHKVRQGFEIVVEHEQQPVAIMKAVDPPRRTINEILALMRKDSTGTIDADFAADVEAAI